MVEEKRSKMLLKLEKDFGIGSETTSLGPYLWTFLHFHLCSSIV